MLFSLPPSLLALVFCLLESRPVVANPAPLPTPQHGNIAGYIASGLGVNNGSSSHTPSLASTGTGIEYASKCQDALKIWSSASFSYEWSSAIVTTYTFSSAITETLREPGTTEVSSIITLCDGHPRVVGHTSTSRGSKYTKTDAWTNTVTESDRNTAFPTPPPCSIQPEDCKALSSSYDVSLSSALEKEGFATGAGPLCTVTPSSSYSYSMDKGNTCDNCMIHASTARVMFWPVTTASGGDLCNKTASTITSSPTGPPRSFVTEGITITSPTVAVSLGYVSRVDGCGTTVNHTIIPVRPEEVTSVRGYRVFFEHHRFDFADLNYFCMDTGTTNATLDDNVPQDSCYQQVPADAYFGGLNNAVVLAQAPFRNLTKEQMTIWNDYQPQLLPPQTMTDAINKLWGDNCIIHPDGVWDPPIALTEEASLKGPSYGPGTTTEDSQPESTPASPINEYGPVSPKQTSGIKLPSDDPGSEDDPPERQHFTALPETTGAASPEGDGHEPYTMSAGYGGSSSGDGEDDSSSTGSDGQDSDDTHGNSASDGNSASGGSGSSQNDEGHSSNNSDGSSGGSSDASSDGEGNNGGDDNGESNNAESNNGENATGESSNGENSNEENSNNGGNENGGTANGHGHVTGIKVHTTVITVGSKTMTCSEDSNGAWAIPDTHTTHTISMGGSAAKVDGATFTAAADGLTQVHSLGGSSDSDEDSQSDRSGTATSESSTQQSSQPNREQTTGAASATDDSGSSPTSSDSDSSAGNIRWSPANFALAMVAIYLCVL